MTLSSTLYLIDQDSTVTPVARLPKSHKAFHEKWVQDLLYNNPQLLPVQQLKPDAGEFLPIDIEVPFADVGKADLVGVTTGGYPVIVEAKLWRNPQARREVMSQLIDYIKEMVKKDYGWFEKLWTTSRSKNTPQSLFKAASDISTIEIDEIEFADRIGHACQEGDVLGFIVGDGIQHGLSELVSHLTKNSPHLRYSMTLLELRCHELPTGSMAVIPNIVQEVSPVERAYFRIEIHPELAGRVKLSSVVEPTPSDQTPKRKLSLTEDEFWEELEAKVGAKDMERTRDFVSEVQRSSGLKLYFTPKMMILRLYHPDEPDSFINIFSIYADGGAYCNIDSPDMATKSWGIPDTRARELFKEYWKQLNETCSLFKIDGMHHLSRPVSMMDYVDHLDEIAAAIQSICTNLRAAAGELRS